MGGEFVFAHARGGQGERFAQPDGLRDDLGDQFLDGTDPDDVEHLPQLGGITDTDVSFNEIFEHFY